MIRRRSLLRAAALGLPAILAGHPALAGLSRAAGVTLPAQPPLLQPYVHISYGQSWRDNPFFSFGSFNFNPEPGALYGLHLPIVGAQGVPPATGPLQGGPADAALGIHIPSLPDGICGYGSAYPFTIGRCAVLAQQLLRAANFKSVTPILEFCAAYPSSTWTTGAGGGLQPGGTSWTNMLALIAAIQGMPLQGQLQTPQFASVGYTQFNSASDSASTYSGKLADLTAMLTDFDGLGLAGPALKFYLGLPATTSNNTIYALSALGTYYFCRTNAPGQGGPWSGRCFGTAPSYQWPFNGGDNIHTNDYGTARWGEWEGYVKYLAEDAGVSWTPLWRPLSGSPITVSSQRITVPFDRPAGSDFASGTLEFAVGDDNVAGAVIPLAPQMGFHVIRNGVELTVTPSISGLNVLLDITETLSSGDSLTVSYAMAGPGGPNPGTHSGVWGNLVMRGPSSVLFSGKTIDAWAWPLTETVTV